MCSDLDAPFEAGWYSSSAHLPRFQDRSRTESLEQLVARILLGQLCFHFESVTEDFLVMLALRHGRGGPG